jgi:predicted O-methyltransferase YrrM
LADVNSDPAVPSRHEHRRRRVQDVRRRLAADGPPWEREPGDFARVSLPRADGDALRDLLLTEAVETVVEVGLAYGSSALAIGEALVAGAPNPVHVVIDPFQATEWHGAGWEALLAAGLEPMARLIEEPSSLALAGLVREGLTADAAFVDGSHRFHEVFLDLAYLRRIVRPGGLVVLDDHWWPSVRTAERYFTANLGWRVLEDALPGSASERDGHPRMRALRLPDPRFEPAFEAFRPFGADEP